MTVGNDATFARFPMYNITDVHFVTVCAGHVAVIPGSMFQDGQEKTTKLPMLQRGSVLTFETEVLQSGKARVTIDVDEKIATFDWSVDSAPAPSASPVTFQADTSNKIDLYFAMKFTSPGWKISVE